MRSVDAHLLEDKMEEAVTHYIDSHQVQVEDTDGLALSVHDEGARLAYCRADDGAWGDELLEGGLAALVAQLQRPRAPAALPPLQHLKPRASAAWFGPAKALERPPAAAAMPPQDEADDGADDGGDDGAARPPRRSLPHKKRLSRKLRRDDADEPDAFAADAGPTYACRECGLHFGADQLRFYHHLKRHYEPPPPEALPDALVELSAKAEDGGEFSEPEDLMAGIHVCVDAAAFEAASLPHLTVDAGRVSQEPRDAPWFPRAPSLAALKEEALQRTFAGAAADDACFAPAERAPPERPPAPEPPQPPPERESPPPAPRPARAAKAPRAGPPRSPAEPRDAPPPRPPRRWTCATCGREFRHRNSLLYHALSHGERQHACELCRKTFYTVGALKVHGRVHSGDRPYECSACGKTFRQWSDLHYHIASLHSDKKRFRCEFCDKRFARKYSLSVHVRIHTGERNYKCDYCAKTFRASSYRLAHMRTHTGDRPYKCAECAKPFRNAFDLRRHALVHDKLRARRPRAEPAAPPAPAPRAAPPAPEAAGAPAEAVFIERLTALYDVPPV